MSKYSTVTLLLAVILVISSLFCGCTYSNNEVSSNNTESTTVSRKSYTEDEIADLDKHNKYPKSYLIKVGDGECFSSNRVDNNGNVKTVTVTFNKVTKYSNIGEFDKNDFANYKDDIAPYVDNKGNLKTYKRTTSKIVNGGLDEKVVSVNKKAQREFVVLDVEAKNTSNDEVETQLTFSLGFCRFKSLDDEFVTDELHNFSFTDNKGDYAFEESSIYFSPSQCKNIKNVIKRNNDFETYKFKPNETLKCRLGFLIDKDLEDAMIIRPSTGTQLTLQVFK